MIFSLNSEFFQATPSICTLWSHISSISNIFNILSGWEDSITEIWKKDSVLPPEAPDIPLLAKWVRPLGTGRWRSRSGCQVARDVFTVQISDFWSALWNCDRRQRRQTERMGQWGFQSNKAVEFTPKPDRGHKSHSQDTKTVKQKKTFTSGKKKKASTPSLFLPPVSFYSLA